MRIDLIARAGSFWADEVDEIVLSDREIEFVTYRWIGVSGGYLGDFSYRSHYDFYADFCDLEEIDPRDMEGTTRVRFERILSEASPSAKVKILRGTLKKFPLGSAPQRTQDGLDRIETFITRCQVGSPVETPRPHIKSQLVDRALADAEALMRSGDAVSAIDRVHTAFHGYLISLCGEKTIIVERDAPTTRLFKLLRTQAPELQITHDPAGGLEKMQNALSSIVDAINPIRNRASLAHPNEALLKPHEAMLVINSIRTVWHYLHSKFAPVPIIEKSIPIPIDDDDIPF